MIKVPLIIWAITELSKILIFGYFLPSFNQFLVALAAEFIWYATSENSGLAIKLSVFAIGGSNPLRFRDGDSLVWAPEWLCKVFPWYGGTENY